MRYRGQDYQTQATATGANFPLARGWQPARGTFFSSEDVSSYATVAVLGQTVARSLFPDGSDPVGRHVVINNVHDTPKASRSAARNFGESTSPTALSNFACLPVTSSWQDFVHKTSRTWRASRPAPVARIGR